jgi:predicted methyltransferase
MIKATVFCVTLLFSAGVFADTEFTCTMGDTTRTISVVYTGSGLVPCEVRYDRGQGAEVLWSAENTEGYCENQARQFVSKQEGFGYSCSESMASSDATVPSSSTGTMLAQDAPSYVTAAVADTARPAEHRADDAVRLPAATLAFAMVLPGDVVAELRPGGGYYTRLLSKVVGANGKVYAVDSAERLASNPDRMANSIALAAEASYANVEVATPPSAALDLIGEPVDVVWTSANYHDMVNGLSPEELAAFNAGVFRALKPGGIYFILDHAAQPGTGISATNTIHRIDVEAVKQQVTAAGFTLEAEGDALIRPEDDRTTQGKFENSQFMLRFRKPQ